MSSKGSPFLLPRKVPLIGLSKTVKVPPRSICESLHHLSVHDSHPDIIRERREGHFPACFQQNICMRAALKPKMGVITAHGCRDKEGGCPHDKGTKKSLKQLHPARKKSEKYDSREGLELCFNLQKNK